MCETCYMKVRLWGQECPVRGKMQFISLMLQVIIVLRKMMDSVGKYFPKSMCIGCVILIVQPDNIIISRQYSFNIIWHNF